MITQIKTVFRNSRATLIEDAFGVLALIVMMFIALHVPGIT